MVTRSNSTPSSTPRERRRVWCEPVAVGAHRAGEYQDEAGGAVFQIVESLRIGGGRIGMIDPLHDRPGGARRASGNGAGVGSTVIQRLDGQAVIGSAFQALEWRALEHGGNELAPVVIVAGAKSPANDKVSGAGHRLKMPWVARSGQYRSGRIGQQAEACNCRAAHGSKARTHNLTHASLRRYDAVSSDCRRA